MKISSQKFRVRDLFIQQMSEQRTHCGTQKAKMFASNIADENCIDSTQSSKRRTCAHSGTKSKRARKEW
jgi:hypothetical protein